MDFQKMKEKAISECTENRHKEKIRILIGMGTCGRAAGAEEILEALKEALAEENLHADIVQVGCIGLCFAEPLI